MLFSTKTLALSASLGATLLTSRALAAALPEPVPAAEPADGDFPTAILSPMVDSVIAARDPQSSSGGGSPSTFLNQLTQLLAAYYASGLKNNTQSGFQNAGLPDPFYANFQTLAAETANHVTMMGGSNNGNCGYGWGMTEGTTGFVLAALQLQGIVLSAYVGSTQSNTLVQMTANMARHNSYLRNAIMANTGGPGEAVPFPIAVDTPLNTNQAYALTANLFGSCAPSGMKAGPSLTLQLGSPSPVSAGAQVTLFPASTNGYSGSMEGAFLTNAGFVYFDVKQTTSNGQTGYVGTIPSSSGSSVFGGQSYVALTQGKTTNIVAGPATLEVVPSNTGSRTS